MRSAAFERTLEQVTADLIQQSDELDLAVFRDNIRRYCDVNMVFNALRENGQTAATARKTNLTQHVWWRNTRLGEATRPTPTLAVDLPAEFSRDRFPAYDTETVVRGCWLAVASVLGVAATAESLKSQLLAAMNALQRSCIPCDPDAVVVSFANAELLNVMARESVVESPLLPDERRFAPDEQARIVAAIRDAFEYIRAVDSELHDVIVMVTGGIACIKRQGSSGSLSSLIGLVWLNPTEDWTVVDYAENIVHEFIHTTIFIEDLLFGVFTKPHFYVPPEALVRSAILKYPRGFNIAFHSVYVAIGLSIFLRAAHQYERAEQVADGLPATVPQLRAIEGNHLTPHGRARFATIVGEV